MIMRYYFDHLFDPWEDLFLQAGAQPCHFRRGEFLVSPGESLTSLFYVKKGIFKCSILTDQGAEQLQSIQGPGAMLPVKYRNFHFSLEPSFAMTALTEVEALRLTPELLRRLAMEHRDLGERALEAAILYSNMLTTRLFQSGDGSESKVCTFLYIYLQNGPTEGSRIELIQEDVAAATGLSRIQVARVYQRLREQGILKVERRAVTVLDPTALRELCPDILVEDNEGV